MDTRNYKLDHKLKIKSEDLIYHSHEYDLDITSNHIYLTGIDRGYEVTDYGEEPGVDFMMAARFIRNLNLCMRANPEKPLVIHMKTCGGSWTEGMAIYDAIKSYPFAVTILNYTHARSMSSLIFQAANKRVMMPHSYFMFHDGTYSVSGTMKLAQSSIDFDRKNTDVMLGIYAVEMSKAGEKKGQSVSSIKSWLRREMDKKEDVFLSSSETVALGLADEIFDSNWSSLTQYTKEQLER